MSVAGRTLTHSTQTPLFGKLGIKELGLNPISSFSIYSLSFLRIGGFSNADYVLSSSLGHVLCNTRNTTQEQCVYGQGDRWLVSALGPFIGNR